MKKFFALVVAAFAVIGPALISPVVSAAEKDLRFQADYELNTTGEYNTNTFFSGNKLKDSSTTRGIGFQFGGEIENSGNYEYGFHAANKIVVNGKYEKDLFAFGNQIVISSEAQIARDLYAAGNKIEIKANIPGTAFVAARRIVLNNVTIDGDLRVAAAEVEIIGDVKITGTFAYNEDLNIIGESDFVAGHTEMYQPLTFGFRLGKSAKIIFAILSLAMSIVTSIVFILIAKKFFNYLKERTKEADGMFVLKKFGIGLLAAVVTPIAAVVLIATIIGIPAAIILLFAFMIALVLSLTIFAAFVGNKIMQNQSTILSATIVLVVLALVGMIPVVGWVLNTAGVLIGFGILVSAIFEKNAE